LRDQGIDLALAETVAVGITSHTVPARPNVCDYPDIYCIFGLAKSHAVPHYLQTNC
jgi:hypothetical protein